MHKISISKGGRAVVVRNENSTKMYKNTTNGVRKEVKILPSWFITV